MTDTPDNNKISKNTVDIATGYVDTPAANFSAWKVKDLGLQFLLFGIAELNAKRVVRLSQKIYELEDVVFSEENLRELDPKGALAAYKLASESQAQMLEYISKTRKEMDWTSISSQLAEMAIAGPDDDAGNVDFTRIATKLIEAMKNSNNDDDDDEVEDNE